MLEMKLRDKVAGSLFGGSIKEDNHILSWDRSDTRSARDCAGTGGVCFRCAGKGDGSCQGASKTPRRTNRRAARRRQKDMTEPGKKGLGGLLAESVQQVARPVSRELLPLPTPFPENEEVESEWMRGLSRAVRSRVKRRVGWQGWANAGVRSMNDVFKEVGRLRCNSPLCHEFVMLIRGQALSNAILPRKPSKRFAVPVPGCTGNGVKQATFKDVLVSLPDPGAKMADGSALLTGSDFEAWRDCRRVLLCSPSDLQEAIALEGRVVPHTDPELKRKPQCFARRVRDVSLRGLVSFGPPSKGTVGVFVVPKKQGKQRFIFDTRRVNQHFRRPWQCMLPTLACWAGFQLPIDPTNHMAQTSVNTAFCRILAPPGMSEYFMLPSVSTQILLREGVNVPDHLRHLPDVSPQLQVLAMGFSLALYFCQKMLESGGRLAYGSSPGTCDDSRFGLFRGSC